VHDAGFAAAIPGHPSASAGSLVPPVSHIRLTLADKPVEVTYRMDNVTTQLLMEPFAVALATAYAENRAKDRAHVRASRVSGTDASPISRAVRWSSIHSMRAPSEWRRREGRQALESSR